MTSLPLPRLRPAAVLLTMLTLSACGADTATTEAEPPAAPEAASDGFPVTVENCGRSITFDAPPERIVTGWITGTELLIELGAEDKIVGLYNTSAFGSPRPQYADAYGELEVLSEAAPTREALLAADPDLLYADGNYLFDGTQLPTVEELSESGIEVIVLSGFCDDGGASTTLDVQEDLAALGPLLGVQEQTETLDAEVLARLDDVEPVDDELPVAVVSVFDGTVFVYEGVYTDMLERAGGTNVYDGTLPEGTYFGQLSVEDLTSTDPGTLVYLLSGAETEQAARGFLQKTFPTVAAVRDDRIVFLPSEDSSNLRAVDGVEALAEGLQSLG